MFTRRTARAIAVAAGLTAPLLVSGFAWADSASITDDGEVPDPTTPGQTLVIYVAIPIVVSLLIWLATKVPGWFRAPRYRPTREWDHDPLWFAGPADAQAAITSATDIRVRGGGASAGW